MTTEELVEDVAQLIVGVQNDGDKKLMKYALSDCPDSLRTYVRGHLMRRVQVLVIKHGESTAVSDQAVTLILERLKTLL